MEKINSKKNILVIGTGGTIAGVGESGITGNYKSAQVKIKEIIKDIPYIKSVANVKSMDMFQIDSCDITMENLRTLAQFINEKSQQEDIDGFVITHGTDTLEETAYFLNLTLKTQKPVVLTGSMRPSTALSTDGPLNLYQAISLAASDEAKGKGVLVSFSDTVYSAREVSKINTFRTQAFSQRDLGCLGYMKYEKPFFYTLSAKKHTTKTTFDLSSVSEIPRVEILYFYPNANSKILDTMAEVSDGIIIAGAGSGGVSNELSEKIESLLKKGLPIVRSSRVGSGLVTFDEEEIAAKGVCANDLNPQKARILLSLALTVTKDLKEIQEIFNTY